MMQILRGTLQKVGNVEVTCEFAHQKPEKGVWLTFFEKQKFCHDLPRKNLYNPIKKKSNF